MGIRGVKSWRCGGYEGLGLEVWRVKRFEGVVRG